MNQANDPSHQRHEKTSIKSKKVIIGTVVSLLLVASIASSSFFYLQYQSAKNDPGKLSQDQTARLKEKVGKIIQIPNEEPTVAKITDQDKLKDQPFFEGTKNGDQLLIFPKAKLAIIYRESENKVIKSGPITLTDTNVTKPTGDASKSKPTGDSGQ